MKILVVRVGRAGDMVMITPALNALLAAFPEAELHLLTSPEGRRVLHDFHARLTRAIIYRTGTIWEMIDRRPLLRELRSQRYDRVYCFEADSRFHRLLTGTAAGAHFLLMNPCAMHYCERCLALVQESLDHPIQRTWVTLPVTEAARSRAASYLGMNGIEEDACVVGFHTTSSADAARTLRKKKARLHRSWPPESFVRLSHLLHEHARSEGFPLRVVIDVLPAERKLVEPMIERSRGAILMMSAQPDFERYKAVLQRMALLVTPDTGPMHIAAAVGTPLVALFSRKMPADCGPYAPPDRHTVLRAEESPNPQLGLAGITPESVFRAALRYLPRLESAKDTHAPCVPGHGAV